MHFMDGGQQIGRSFEMPPDRSAAYSFLRMARDEQDDYQKNRNYWKYLKTKLKENSQLVSGTNQLKLSAPDGKKYLTDTLDYDGVALLAKSFPNNKASRLVEWFTNSDETIDGFCVRFLREEIHRIGYLTACVRR